MVIYPCGKRDRLDVAYVRWYQKDEWALASAEEFAEEREAAEHAVKLANRYRLDYVGPDPETGGKTQHYLD
jgi:hypothetical protein